MSKYQPMKNKNIPVGTVAPISKKPAAGSTGKGGAGFVPKSGKTSNTFGSRAKSTFGSSSNAKSSAIFGSGTKSSSSLGSNAKSNAFGMGGKSPSSPPTSKSPSFIPFGSSGKDNSFQKDKKSTVPLLLGGKTTSAFASSPSKSYPSTSFASPKKSKTTFGIIWLPSKRHNKKKEYVHVSHNNEGYKERLPSIFPHEHNQ